jgi:hypothetical protein
MGRDRKVIGKVVKSHLGYNIRQMVTKKTDEKTKVSLKTPTGRFGVYAGKKSLADFPKVEDAVAHVNEIHSRKK